MTSLGSLVHTGRAWGKTTAAQAAFDYHAAADTVFHAAGQLNASGVIDPITPLGGPSTILASITAWTMQDDDAHEPCSLTACRHPLHPGPCKGWKGTLHAVSPGTYKQIEEERVRKANERRVKRIADLRSQGKPIPRRLLTEIKPKPAPTHAANNAQAVPLGQVNQKADLAGGQAHAAGQAVSKAAGVTPNTAPPLPLGPKQKKPTVAGRGPAFVITQPKVTDTYKLDKADKITPQEWASLSDADKTTIRNELTAIKARGFGPQQTKADALLAKLPAPVAGQKPSPNTNPGAANQPTPGKVSLGQAAKPTAAAPTTAQVVTQARSLDQAHTAMRITEALYGKQNADPTKLADQLSKMKAGGPLEQTPGFRLLVDRLANSAQAKATADKMPNVPGITDFNHQIRDHIAQAKPGLPPAVQQLVDHRAKAVAPATPQLPAPAPSPARGTRDGNGILNRPVPGGAVSSTSVGLPSGYRITRDSMGYSLKHNGKLIRTSNDQKALEKYAHDHAKGASGTPTPSPSAAPASSPTPQAPGPPNNTPQAFPPHVQHARAVAGRALGGRPTAKVHVDTYGKLSKADFDSLDSGTQRTIRDDLANAKAKFLDPKKQQAAADLLDRFGSRHTTPVANGPGGTSATSAKTYTVTHNGKTITRTSTKPYTHASVVRWADGTEEVASFHTSEAAALKGVLTAQQKRNGAQVIKAIAVKADTGPKGYSDPMNEAVKAASGGLTVTDDVLKRVGQLSRTSIGNLDDADRKTIANRLAFIATHPKATAERKARAAAYGRIMVSGPHGTPAKRDHEPSIAELHTEETKSGAAKAAAAVADALVAADAPNMPAADRMRDLAALSKAQFDALTPEQQRKITDALQELHYDRQAYSRHAVTAPDAEKAMLALTGLHPGIHRMRQAETDFRAGKIDGQELINAYRTARVQSPTVTGDPKSPGALLDKEAQRVAEDNPKLPLWARATLIDNDYNVPGGVYGAVSQASMQHNWAKAPRLSSSDISTIFKPTVAQLDGAHPIQAEAVKALRNHLIETGLRGEPGVPTGSPWSLATRNAVADAFLGVGYNNPEVSPERLKEYQALHAIHQALVRKVLEDRLKGQADVHAKTTAWITLRALEGKPPLTGTEREAVLAASRGRYPTSDALDAYRRLDPQDFNALPTYTQDAIKEHLRQFQVRAEQGGPVTTFGPQDNPLKVMPAALAAHLDGTRNASTDRRVRMAADVANYGTGIVNPFDRVRAYRDVPVAPFRSMPSGDQTKINDDLGKIANNTSLPLPIRYDALLTKDVALNHNTTLNIDQLVALGAVDPRPAAGVRSDAAVTSALNDLTKGDYDSLDPVFRTAIDERIKTLPGGPQQALTAKFHPQAAAAPTPATPGGFTPTTVQPNVPPHVQAALDTIYGVHPKSHTMAQQLSTYGALRGNDFAQLNGQEQGHLLGDLSFIATTAKGPSADKARKLIDRFTPPGTPSGQAPTPAIVPPVNAVAGQVRYATPLKGLAKAKDSGKSGDGWITLPGGQRVWGAHGAAGLLLQHVDPQTGEKRYLMVQRGPAISDPGKWTFPGGASDSKETPHQGATRETIEELGLKDDVFKDALVHGDHTFTIPGSTWKYTTVAAQVPNMIKPDLSTAHARAETSDAKWMTLAEIQALDASGKLHAPIAGGKLENNVISLFPQGTTGVKLGQVARPGPITKRLGRLAMPFGGRQSPANFNAWPHAHKPSKGKNLVGSKTDIDTMRQRIKQDRKLYDGKTADGRLAAIGAMQGFDDTPTVLEKKEIDRLLATGDYIEAWRGVTGAGGGWSARGRGGSGGKTAAQINDEMRSGPAYYGKGIFGNGYYLATQKRVAEQYSDHSKGSLVRVLIPKSAVMEKYDKVEKEAQANSSRLSKAKGSSGYELSTFWDPGRWGAAKGIDGIEINPHHRAHGGGGAGHVASSGKPAFNWLNRAVLILQKEPG